ncbi:MAG: hypothetical protein IAE99_12065 [Rhodothermales bacterium]|nr:hypothetical protein [Rhodothermales bacterium]MCA0270052.1 hypothetical protein [Bacteroidota bacterium]
MPPPSRRRPPSVSPFDLFSFAMAGILLVSAAVVLEGSLFPRTLTEARITFGVVLLLLGVYRIVVTLARRRAAREEMLMDELRAEVREEVRRTAETDPS